MTTGPRIEEVCIPREHPLKHDWRVARLTELRLMGHSLGQVRHFLNMSKTEFDLLLWDAVSIAKAKQIEACKEFMSWEEWEPVRRAATIDPK